MDEYESTNEVTKTNILWLRMAWLAEFGGHYSYKSLILSEGRFCIAFVSTNLQNL